jgi:hypothetical protein
VTEKLDTEKGDWSATSTASSTSEVSLDAPIQVVTFEAKPRIPCAVKKTARLIDLVADFRT